ncbi:MAG: hypothetical protein COB46_07820 [Rhodospirillaceae bacterium]|nr:MAG: hypothetical protein COB46_07820 [Rhodospirillaceae bacterium]
MADMSDLELLDALGVEAKSKKKAARTPLEERIIAGFEEIQRFVDQNGRLPSHGEDNDIFERLYATRLDQIRRQEECRNVVQELDHQGLLDGASEDADALVDDLDDDELLSQLGVSTPSEGHVTQLQHVKPRAEVRAAEDVANRTRCEDFDKFKPLFEAVQTDLKNGIRKARPFEHKSEIQPGSFFIVGGQKAYVADMEKVFTTAQGMSDARLRVIYDNGTESNVLMRSLQRALHKDDAGRRITDPSAGPLFSGENDDEDLASGTIYVLRSKSDHPMVSESRDVIHKIGVTGGSVEKRIANAKLDPTFLMADVEIVATYELYNINRTKLENVIHKFFEAAKLDIEIKDRFGNPVVPREWFLVPLFAINDAVEKIKDGTIGDYAYDLAEAKIMPLI